MVGDRRNSAAEKPLHHLGGPDGEAMTCEDRSDAPAAQYFAVDEHAVAIEDHQIELPNKQ
jgi:hypothetical protein